MKAIFISGSPRKYGNTMRLLKKLKEGVHTFMEVEIVHLSDLDLNGCLGCSHCQENLHDIGCVQVDDVDKLLHKIQKADIVLYGTPLYGHSYSGQLKLFLDRHVALFKFIDGEDKATGEMTIHSLIKDKPVGLVVSCQGPEAENTELMKAQFDLFCKSSLTNSMGTFVFPWCDRQAESSVYDEDTLLGLIDGIRRML